jgi:glycosyltransferase involved in cell wall biosynthesis
MRILLALTYYRPHYSGLTIYVERLARALAQRGHQVTVLTSRFSPELPARQVVDGVEIIRPAVGLRVSKGVIMPSLPYWAWKLIRRADVVNVHVPQLDAALVAGLARLLGRPVVMTYHCDLRLPPGLVHRLANLASNLANTITASAASVVVTNTRDYAESVAFLRPYLGKLRVVPPSVVMPEISPAELEEFRRRRGLSAGQPVIGMLARLATEKGVETLVQALPLVLQAYPQARVLYAGQYENVLGEEAYARRLMPLIQGLGGRWSFLGVIPDREAAAFFQACDVTVLPSLNSTESFGMVQVESMICGTPVAASDLPGVRQPVLMTGMGLTVPPADPQALAQAILAILARPGDFRGDTAQVRRRFAPETIAAEYEAIFAGLLKAAALPGEESQPAGGKLDPAD